MNILVLGDIVGESAVKRVKEILPKAIKENDINFVIANGENSADGMGITSKIFKDLMCAGVNVVTMGNHTWGKKDIFNIIENKNLLRPANYPKDVLGNGYGIYEYNNKKIAVINLIGRVDMNVLSENPFIVVEEIINKIKEMEPNSEFLYIGTTNRMEKDLIPSMGYRYEGIEVTGFKRKLTLDNFKTITNFINAIKRCKIIIKDFDPDIVIGCGGYVTAPVIYAAKKLGKKTFIHEQNSVVGLANKFLARYTDKIGVSFESTIKDFPKGKAILTGNPCSEKALSIKKTTKEKLGITKDKKLVLIVMGSLGSKTINDKIFSFIDKFRSKNYSVIIVTGNSYYERVKDKRVPSNVKVLPFIYEMPSVMKITDLMVTRAGASTMSEITALEVPSIFIPSPYVTNNHQYKNAMDLVDNNAGLILEEKDLTDTSLINLIDKTINDENKLKEMKSNLKKLGIKDSGERIYNILKDLILDERKFY